MVAVGRAGGEDDEEDAVIYEQNGCCRCSNKQPSLTNQTRDEEEHKMQNFQIFHAKTIQLEKAARR